MTIILGAYCVCKRSESLFGGWARTRFM